MWPLYTDWISWGSSEVERREREGGRRSFFIHAVPKNSNQLARESWRKLNRLNEALRVDSKALQITKELTDSLDPWYGKHLSIVGAATAQLNNTKDRSSELPSRRALKHLDQVIFSSRTQAMCEIFFQGPDNRTGGSGGNSPFGGAAPSRFR